MSEIKERLRVLYCFPLRLGPDRIYHTAWQQADGSVYREIVKDHRAEVA
jgi:hypothetical protein